MSKSHERLLSEVRGVRKLLDALSRAQTSEQVFASCLNSIHDIFSPNNAYVLLPEPGMKKGETVSEQAYRPGWITDLAVPVFLNGDTAGHFMLHFDGPRGVSEVELSLMETIALLASVTLARIHEQHQFHQALKLKNEAVAMAVHELRAPLTTILGAVSLLQSDRQEEHERAIQMISRSARAQEQLIADLLNLTQLDAGKTSLRLAVMDVVPIVEEVVEGIRQLPTENISITTELQGPIMVRGDAQRLWQVFWNLLSNAVRFVGPKGEIRVLATVKDGHAKVCVSDNGCGIQSERIDHIFDRFEQAHDPRAKTYNGFGLGLAVVKEFVSMLGGTVAAHSDGPGKGAVFTVWLPRVP
jgi:signal transduction histidine kinase